MTLLLSPTVLYWLALAVLGVVGFPLLAVVWVAYWLLSPQSVDTARAD